MKQTTKIIAISAASLALVGGVSVGIAAADPTPSPTPSGTPTASSSPTAKADQQGQRGRLIRRALHGEVTLAGPKHRVVVFQRGSVDKISATSVTVTSNDGFTDTYTIAAATKVRENKAPGSLGDITPQDKVRVVAVKTGKTVTARVIVERTK